MQFSIFKYNNIPTATLQNLPSEVFNKILEELSISERITLMCTSKALLNSITKNNPEYSIIGKILQLDSVKDQSNLKSIIPSKLKSTYTRRISYYMACKPFTKNEIFRFSISKDTSNNLTRFTCADIGNLFFNHKPFRSILADVRTRENLLGIKLIVLDHCECNYNQEEERQYVTERIYLDKIEVIYGYTYNIFNIQESINKIFEYHDDWFFSANPILVSTKKYFRNLK